MLQILMKILLFILLTLPIYGQSVLTELIRSKSFWVGNSAAFVGGAFDGTNQTVLFHYPAFKKVFPNANDQYFNPAISWTNKYKPPTFGKSTFLVATTDFYHLTRAGDNFFTVTVMPVFNSASIDLFDKSIPGKTKWRHIKKKALEGVSHMVFRQIGFTLMYDGVF